ncbi:inhibitor of growth protein [Holotrichia oblita]|uniref:Inhibitor of growth protein n=2 Tax=Holotrichia oblita TaxID=644536 RepID=A0ACB9SVL7_HOLOL|nr:inhibitor of growth protein [Holotrichia oblita]KAI4458591.1 inhibitor of growth protein [Holotrichia oblita]
MLYLEDYLEMIEHLPQELRDRFTEMRELDLSVQNNIDELEKRVKILFSDCKRYPNELPATTDLEFQAIRKEYYSTLEEADEKVQLASQMYELVEKYLRRLDTELHKFKCELEADNKGITELLEKRSLELDSITASQQIPSHQQKENRYERYRPRSEKRRDSSQNALTSPFSSEKRSTSSGVTLVESRHLSGASTGPTSQSSISYNLGHIGAGPAIAAAASQAIAATQQMQQGRRTASLKASYEAINTGVHVTEFGIGRDLAGAAQTAIQAIQQDHHNNKKKHKKWSSVANGTEVTDGEWSYDPNEPRYCLCNQVSYGDMVACDNEDCPSEWFHYPCVVASSDSEAIISSLRQRVNEFINKETVAVENRIRKFTEDQYKALDEYRDRVFKEHHVLKMKILEHKLDTSADNELSTNNTINLPQNKPKSSNTTVPDAISNNTNSPLVSKPKPIVNNKSPSKKRNSDLTYSRSMSAYGNSYDAEVFFPLEDMQDEPTFEQSDFEDSDQDDLPKDDGSDSIQRQKQSSQLAKSLPVNIPVFMSAYQNHLNEDNDDDLPDESMDIAASIKALAKSIQGGTVFGELPRSRFSSQI